MERGLDGQVSERSERRGEKRKPGGRPREITAVERKSFLALKAHGDFFSLIVQQWRLCSFVAAACTGQSCCLLMVMLLTVVLPHHQLNLYSIFLDRR